MLRYLIKQFFLSVIKLYIFVTLMFFLIQIIMPGDFVDQYSLFLNREERDALRTQLGLDQPMLKRYFNWLNMIIHGDLGISLWGENIAEALKYYVPTTLLVFLTGTVIAFLIGLVLGKYTAWQGSPSNRTT